MNERAYQSMFSDETDLKKESVKSFVVRPLTGERVA
jgi:hypothetical protein